MPGSRQSRPGNRGSRAELQSIFLGKGLHAANSGQSVCRIGGPKAAAHLERLSGFASRRFPSRALQCRDPTDWLAESKHELSVHIGKRLARRRHLQCWRRLHYSHADDVERFRQHNPTFSLADCTDAGMRASSAAFAVASDCVTANDPRPSGPRAERPCGPCAWRRTYPGPARWAQRCHCRRG